MPQIFDHNKLYFPGAWNGIKKLELMKKHLRSLSLWGSLRRKDYDPFLDLNKYIHIHEYIYVYIYTWKSVNVVRCILKGDTIFFNSFFFIILSADNCSLLNYAFKMFLLSIDIIVPVIVKDVICNMYLT